MDGRDEVPIDGEPGEEHARKSDQRELDLTEPARRGAAPNARCRQRSEHAQHNRDHE